MILGNPNFRDYALNNLLHFLLLNHQLFLNEYCFSSTFLHLFHFFSNGLKIYEYKNVKSKAFGSFLKKEEFGNILPCPQNTLRL